MATKTKRGLYDKGIARKNQIITVATQVFAAEGYNVSSVKEIAKACSISRAGLLYYFPSKRDLLFAVLRKRDTDDAERFMTKVERRNDGLDDLRAIVELTRQNVKIPWIIRFYVILSAEATQPDHPAYLYFKNRYDHLRRVTVLSFKKAREAGVLREEVNIDSIATNLNALMDGLQVQWLLDPSSVDMVREIQHEIQLYIKVPLYQPD